MCGGGGTRSGTFPGGTSAPSARLHVYKGVSEEGMCPLENLKDFETFHTEFVQFCEYAG